MNIYLEGALRTIVTLSDRITELEAELSAVAAHSLTQGKKLRAQSQQLDRVQEALHRIERADEQAQHDWDTKADMLAQGTAMGYSMSAQWLEEALGDTHENN